MSQIKTPLTPKKWRKTTQERSVRRPRLFRLFFLNDQITTKEFVVDLLQSEFGRNSTEAVTIMLLVHHYEQAQVGVYPLEIAETKVARVRELAGANNFPLQTKLEPEQ